MFADRTEADLDKKFWGEATNYLQNILPTKAANMTPYELEHDQKPSYAHLRMIGSTVWIYIPSQKRRKLDQTAERMVLVSYLEGRNAYRQLNSENLYHHDQ